MATTLTEKYVHAVTRALPEDQRDDVADELRATIADRVDSLLAEDAGLPGEKAEYVAIEELDDPDRLAAGYTGRSLHLIGPANYPAYVRLLKALLITVVPIVAVVAVTTGILVDRSFGAVVGHTAWTTLNVAVHLFFWVTLVWVLAERGASPDKVNERLLVRWTPDDLPEPPRASEFKVPDVVASVVFLGLAIAWIVGQHFFSWVSDANGDPVPTLAPGLWSGWLPLVVAALVGSIVFEIVRFRAGHWTTALVAVHVLLGLAFAVPVVFLAATDALLNPAAFARLAELGTEVDPGHVNTIVVITVVVITAWEIGDSVRRAKRA